MIMTKFNVYALVMLSNTTNPEPKLTQFIEWNLRRSLSIWERSEMEPKARMDETMVFWRNFLTLPQTQTLRNQIKEKNPQIWKTLITLGNPGENPPRNRKILYIAGSTCPGCLAFEREDLPKLQKLGYTLGDSEKDHLTKLTESSEQYQEVSQEFNIQRIPSLILIEDGKPSIVIESNRKRIDWKDALRLYNHGYHGYPILGL